MQNTIFYIIIGIIIFDYLFERILDYLNLKHTTTDLPAEVSDVYDQKEYEKSQRYKKINNRFGLITSTFSFLLILGMLIFEGFAWVDQIARQLTEHPVLLPLVFFGILFIASDILTTPFSIYDTFVIEEKFGFNKTTPKIFIFDKLKGYLLTIVFGGGILAIIVWFYQLTGQIFWVYTWIFITAFSLFMTMFYSNLIVPLFNKQRPLEEGELRTEIERFSENAGFKLDNIFVIDGSKRSNKSNAYFTGIGPKKRIVLFDTLIKDLSKEEIVAVLAHEIGHYKKKHIVFSLASSIIQTGITLYILSLFVDSTALARALGSNQPSFHLGLIAFGILYSPINFILGILSGKISRKNEYQADQFAQNKYNGEYLISALKKLSSKNLSNLTPHPLYVFFHYSHPTLLQRIRNIRQIDR